MNVCKNAAILKLLEEDITSDYELLLPILNDVTADNCSIILLLEVANSVSCLI